MTKTSFENIAHRLFWFLVKNIGYNIGTCFKASFPIAFAPEYKRFDKSEEPSEEGPYTITSLHPETSPVNRTNLPTTTLIYVVLCISIHCNWQTEIYCSEDFFLKCNITRDGISLSSNKIFSPLFITRRIEIDAIGLFHWLEKWVVKSMVTLGRWDVQGSY